MHQRAGVKLHQDGMPKASTGGLLLGDKQDEKRIASPENVPQASSVASPRACSRCLTGLLVEPQLPFSIPIQNASLMLALWSCGRRVASSKRSGKSTGLLLASYAATYALRPASC
jgi:hypothetical protein